MGVSFSCFLADCIDLDSGFEAIIVKSIGLESTSVRTALRSISFSGHDSELTILKSLHSGRMIIEGSVSFKPREMEISIKSPSSDKERNVIVNADSIKSREIDNPSLRSDSIKSREIDHPSLRSDSETEKNKEKNVVFSANSFESREFDNPSLKSGSIIEKTPRIPLLRLKDPKHEAALKLQKVYKSFRTRRKLADCAVLVEQRWWKLLEFAELKRSSISFFEVEKHETAISRWLRARSRAAKVGKGLSKDDKAQKLALQHWLEAIDPRHRYGHNLHYYYVKWCHCESPQPFFYWLDIGDGKEVNLIDRCPRYKLQQQCIKYLGPIERKAFEVILEDGKFFYKQTKELLNTCGGPKDAKWIFVLSTTKTLYVGKKSKGKFQHSSFLAGGATSAAGRIVVQDGILKAIWPHSGHYRPTKENFQEFVSFLKEHNVDLTDVKKHVAEEEEELLSGHGSTSAQNSTEQMTDLQSEDTNIGDLTRERTDLMEQDINISLEEPKCLWSHGFKKKLTKLQIPNRNNVFDISEGEYLSLGPNCRDYFVESPMDGYETAEESFDSEENHLVPKRNLFEEDQEEHEEDIVPKESILRRINSHKGMKSYQLGKQLSCRWTTGAGPRIGCVRDYPSLLQFRALEQVNLSPRSSLNSRASPRNIMELNSKVSSLSPLSNHKRSFSTQQM